MDTNIQDLKTQLDRIESKLDRLLSALQVETQMPDQVPEPPTVELLSIEQAAEVLGMALGAVRKNIKMIPHTEERGKFYFIENELLAYIESDFSKSQFKKAQKASTKYIGFDYKQWLSEKIRSDFIGQRDKAIDRESAKKRS